ncbi:hypothetical protein T8K17_15380 [Thalassobaculum sp. OXR-137]|uniref:hypothetical protein n=1 Tax=Thalassobaculum sp. OXR-137 TaxID=3100173 RepID=UPI002AC9BF22|nr:hypothetical protein [Thalassobaculum sp. OXR-137]WPZ32621.1 hypothetical protein T8K17_15380 [Thalassobaculum sp. OXR-137]
MDVDLLSALDDAANPLTPPPAPMPMPAREVRTVGGLMITAMSGFRPFAPAALPQHAVATAVETPSSRR